MRRALPLAALAVLTACASAPPPPEPLAVRDPFPVAYDGRVSPLDDADLPTQGVPQAVESAATLEPRRVVAFRATWFELSLADAHALLPELATALPPPHRVRVAAGHVEPAALDDALARLGDRARVISRQLLALGVGRSGELMTLNQTAFVRSLRLAPAADSLLVDDVDVAVFQHGSRLALGIAAEGGALRVDVEWRETSPLLPIPVARAPMASLQVPVLERHRLTASTTVAGCDGLVLGSLPSGVRDTVRLLCIEVDADARLAGR